ncbi:MAG TPA: VIT domain-containing protein [Gemmatimonadales bacterium]|nr:VIT domain-containing protein [Gemmatimonadales bacterium]
MFDRRLVVFAILSAAPLTPAAAQGWILPTDRPIAGVPPRNGPVVRVGSEVRVTIEGRVARFEVEERFRNDGGRLAEGTYLYPLPGEAIFNDFSLFLGDEELRGEMMNAEQAKAIYEEIVRQQLDPALITLAGHGLIRARVFPIQPGETRRIILRYTQVLSRDGDALRLRYAFGARGGGADVNVRVRMPASDEWGTPYSPTHQVVLSRNRDATIARVINNGTGTLDLFLPIRRGLVGASVLTHATGGEEGFYMLLLAPAASADRTVIPRDLTLVVDVSGSMSGGKMEQARAALHQALGNLRSTDRFRLITFGSGVGHFRHGFAPATPEALRVAGQFVDDLRAQGGTNIEGALQATFADPGGTSGRLGVVLFMTDGVPTVGQQDPERLAALAGDRIANLRLFTMGVGHDVNTWLLDQLASEGRGAAEYVAPGADVEVAMGSVLRRVAHPALTGLRIVESPVRLVSGAPAELPDLFYGEELVVFGRYRGTGRGQVVVEGERQGRRERLTIEANFPARSASNEFIPPLWAARRIGELTRTMRLEGQSDALVQEVRELGLRYGILTEYTSYLVQEPGVVVAGGVRPRDLPASLAPSAQSGRASFERAEASASLAKTGSMDAMTAQADREVARMVGHSGSDVKRAGGRVFRRDGERWTDVAHQDSLRVVTVAPYSAAWFAVAQALPELREAMALGDQVTVAGRRASLRVAPSGVANLSPDALARLVRDIRGT